MKKVQEKTFYNWIAIIIIALLFGICACADAQVVRKGNTFEQTSSRASGKATKTQFTFKDTKGNEYPIYVTEKGRCFVMKVSGKTGKEYKYYLKEDISRAVCKELNIEYQEPVKKAIKAVASTIKNVKVKSPSIGGFTATTTI